MSTSLPTNGPQWIIRWSQKSLCFSSLSSRGFLPTRRSRLGIHGQNREGRGGRRRVSRESRSQIAYRLGETIDRAKELLLFCVSTRQLLLKYCLWDDSKQNQSVGHDAGGSTHLPTEMSRQTIDALRCRRIVVMDIYINL